MMNKTEYNHLNIIHIIILKSIDLNFLPWLFFFQIIKDSPRFGGKKPHGPRSWKGKRPSQKDEVAKDEAAETEETAAAHLEGENTENNDEQISIHPHPHSRPHRPHRRGPRGQKPEKS